MGGRASLRCCFLLWPWLQRLHFQQLLLSINSLANHSHSSIIPTLPRCRFKCCSSQSRSLICFCNFNSTVFRHQFNSDSVAATVAMSMVPLLLCGSMMNTFGHQREPKPKRRRKARNGEAETSQAGRVPPVAPPAHGTAPASSSSISLTFANPVQVPETPVQEHRRQVHTEEDIRLENVFQNSVTKFGVMDLVPFSAIHRLGVSNFILLQDRKHSFWLPTVWTCCSLFLPVAGCLACLPWI